MLIDSGPMWEIAEATCLTDHEDRSGFCTLLLLHLSLKEKNPGQGIKKMKCS